MPRSNSVAVLHTKSSPWDLVRVDDVLSDLLIDRIQCTFATRKLDTNYKPVRLAHSPAVYSAAQTIVDQVVYFDGEPIDAAKRVLDLSPVKAILGRIQSQSKEEETSTHAARYLAMYRLDAGFEVRETARYAAVSEKLHQAKLRQLQQQQHQQVPNESNGAKRRRGTLEPVGSEKTAPKFVDARVVSLQDWQSGEIISHCSGRLAPISSEDLQDFTRAGADFSVLWWERHSSMCLLLGPARFVNHDCSPNTRFRQLENGDLAFQAIRKIHVGEEITTSYGPHYFGQNNESCACNTCERHGQGVFSQQITTSTEANVVTNGNGVAKLNGEYNGINGDSKPPSPSLSVATTDSKISRSNSSEEPLPTTRRSSSQRTQPRRVAATGPRSYFARKSAAKDECLLCCEQFSDAELAAIEKHHQEQLLKPVRQRQPDLPLECNACKRHFYIYGFPWPYRTEPPEDAQVLFNELDRALESRSRKRYYNASSSTTTTATTTTTTAINNDIKGKKGRSKSLPASATSSPAIQPATPQPEPGSNRRMSKRAKVC